VVVRPWGRIEGTLRIGSRPGAGGRIHLQYSSDGDGAKAIPNLSGEAKADSSGHFVLDRVVPGEATLFRVLEIGTFSLGYTHPVDVVVKPGETVHVGIGGMGRPVIGRVTVPSEVAGRNDWAYSMNAIRRVQPEVHAPPDLDATGRNRWFDDWSRSEEGKAYLKAARRADAVKVESDGSFRAEDVEPGPYELLFEVDEPPADPSRCGIGGDRLASARRRFIVPDMPGSRSDVPLDLGAIVLEPAKQAKSLKVGQPAPAFQAEALEGADVKLSDYRGKFVLLDFWATWCKPCLAETPHLKEAHGAFGNDPRFVMLGLSLDPSKDDPLRYVREQGLAWKQGFLGRGAKSKLTGDYGIWGIPSIWLIGPDGSVLAKDLQGKMIKETVGRALGKAR
jgi:thiol-disulfide isomerase/thioredoxin